MTTKTLGTKRWLSGLAATFLLSAAGGCGDLLKQPYPAKEYFGIEPGVENIARNQPSTQSSSNRLMAIRTVRVTAPYDGLALIYQDGPSRFSSDYYANWIAEPAALLTAGLTRWLDTSGPIAVVPIGSSARADWILDCDVTRLLIDRTDPSHPRAVITAHLFLINQSNADTKVVDDSVYEEQSPAAANTPTAYAEAYGRAYRQLLTKIASDLRATFK